MLSMFNVIIPEPIPMAYEMYAAAALAARQPPSEAFPRNKMIWLTSFSDCRTHSTPDTFSSFISLADIEISNNGSRGRRREMEKKHLPSNNAEKKEAERSFLTSVEINFLNFQNVLVRKSSICLNNFLLNISSLLWPSCKLCRFHVGKMRVWVEGKLHQLGSCISRNNWNL